MSNGRRPPAPRRRPPGGRWEHYELYGRVREALMVVPQYFESQIRIVGIPATDIFAFNTILGATIEERVVETLNKMRPVWDPDDEYALYSFVRQSQTFPDVLFKKPGNEDPVLGIELKGWYVLAKEGVPSFRYQVTPGACAPSGLLVVYPWYLSEVISGTPCLLEPYIELARYVAEYRNWYWEHARQSEPNPVLVAEWDTPYPSKGDGILDTATRDQGRNFGRIARVGLLDDYCTQVGQHKLAGIPSAHWLKFFGLFKDAADSARIERAIDMMRDHVHVTARHRSEEEFEGFLALLQEIARLLA